jgi:DNA-binding CsgD family transcriptional regulator
LPRVNGSDADDRFLDALFRGVANADEFGNAVRLIQESFRCRGAALVTVDAQDPTASFVWATGILEPHLERYQRDYAHLDPAPALYLRQPVGKALSTDRMFTPEERDNNQFFKEFFRPLGLVETLGGPIYADQGSFAMIALIRGEDREPFDDAEATRLERLMPHIARALQLRRTFFQIDARSLGLQATLDRLQAGFILLNEHGAALFANAAMRAIAQRGDGFALDRNGRPLPANIEARQRFDALVNDVAKGGVGGILTVPRSSGRDYVILVAPAPQPSTQTHWERRGTIGSTVVVHDPEIGPAPTTEILAQGLGLTNGAARLVASLAADDDLKSFAKAEGFTIHTARFHLRTALARTGAKTQAELVRIAVRLLRDFALADPPMRTAKKPQADTATPRRDRSGSMRRDITPSQ